MPFIIDLLDIRSTKSVTAVKRSNFPNNGRIRKGWVSKVRMPSSWTLVERAIKKSICKRASPPLTVVPLFRPKIHDGGLLLGHHPPSVRRTCWFPLPKYPDCGGIDTAFDTHEGDNKADPRPSTAPKLSVECAIPNYFSSQLFHCIEDLLLKTFMVFIITRFHLF